MLNIIRNNIQSFTVKFIVAIVALVMLFFGVSTYQSQGVNVIATVDNHEIKVKNYQRAFEQARDEIRKQYGNQADQYIEAINLPSQIVNRLINNAMLIKNAEESGFSVTDLELANDIYKNPAFQTDDRFDQKKYDNLLSQNRINKLEYESDLWKSLITKKYFGFVNSRLNVSQRFIDNEFARLQSEVKIKVIELKPEMFAKKVEITNEKLKQYYEENKVKYQKPAKFIIKYFTLNIDVYIQKVTVRDKEIENYYRKNKASEFTEKSSFLSRHILISTNEKASQKQMEAARQKAEMIYKKLQKNKNQFAKLAKKYSKDPGSANKGGNLGWVTKGTFVKVFENEIAKLEKNKISKPFLSKFGYHIVQLLDNKPEKVLTLDKAKAKIEQNIQIKKAKRRLKNKTTKLSKIYGQKSLDELAKEMQKEIIETKAFDDSTELDNISFSYDLYNSLKDKKVNEKGLFETSKQDRVLIYEVTKIEDPFVEALEKVKTSVEVEVQKQEEQKMMRLMLAEYAASTKNIKAFEKVAKKLKIPTKEAKFKLSDRGIEGLGTDINFQMEVSKMSKGQIKAINNSNRSFLVIVLDKNYKTGEEDEKIKNSIAQQLRKQKSDIILSGIINKIRKQQPVKYNDSMLKALNINLN